jgi:hypothetical protein
MYRSSLATCERRSGYAIASLFRWLRLLRNGDPIYQSLCRSRPNGDIRRKDLQYFVGDPIFDLMRMEYVIPLQGKLAATPDGRLARALGANIIGIYDGSALEPSPKPNVVEETRAELVDDLTRYALTF